MPRGWPAFVAMQPLYVTINDVLGADTSGAPFDPDAMPLFRAWAGSKKPERAAIARGAKLFGTKSIAVTGVGGLNDTLGLTTIRGTCTTCLDSPNVGNHSVALPLNIGLADASPEGFHEHAAAQVLGGSSTWAPPVLSNGRIFCRSLGDLVCLDVSGK